MAVRLTALLPEVRLHTRTVVAEFLPGGRSKSIFHGFCEISGERWCSTRRVLDDNWRDSTVELNGQHLGYGEDPRLFVHNGRPALVAAVHVPGFAMRNHLYELSPEGVRCSVLILPEGLAPGKNWSPFSKPDGTIGFVHTFDPVTILREKRREPGVLLLQPLYGASPVTEKGPGGFSAYRGGTNGLWADGLFVGIGHTTRLLPSQTEPATAELGFDHLRHRPFGWVLDAEACELRLFPVQAEFPEEFDVIDPTSLVGHGNGIFEVFTTEVPRHFHDREGRRQVASYRFILDGAFRARAMHELSIRRPSLHRFHSAGGTLTNDGWVVPLAGGDRFVIAGPYTEISPGEYEVVFEFECGNPEGEDATLRLDVTDSADRQLAIHTVDELSALHPSVRTIRFRVQGDRTNVQFRVAAFGFSGGLFRFTGATYRRV